MGREVKKSYLKGGRLPPPNALQTAVLGGAGLLFRPVYGALARLNGAPGLEARRRSFWLGWRLLLRPQAPIDLKSIFFLLCYPMDSTRYFELDFLLRRFQAPPGVRYLDVSSPRLGFVLCLLQHAGAGADLINPDKRDLAETESLLAASGLLSRCRLHHCLVTDAPFAPSTFDLITSISVIEHIPEDRAAVGRMWGLLRPGGRLLLTVPCAAEASEQYMDQDEYGVLGKGADGQVFWQRFYDERWLEERIFSVTGAPRRAEIFGERARGLFQRNAAAKRTRRYYPFWREPYMVSREYRRFESVRELPGEGVAAMEFVKS